MNVFSKSLVVVFIAGFAFSAQAQTVSKADLLKACAQSGKASQVVELMSKELKVGNVGSLMDMNQLNNMTSADEIVQNAMKQDISSQAAQVITQAKVAKDIILLIKPATNRALAVGKAKFGANEVVDSLISSTISGAVDIFSDIFDVAIVMGRAQLNKQSVSKADQEKLTAKLQTSLEQFAVLKVRAAGVQSKVKNMSDKEKSNLAAEVTFVGTQVQVEICKGIVHYVRN